MKQILYNGTFITMDDFCPQTEAVLISEGTIERLGSLKELQQAAPDAGLTDLNGACVLPGFIDGHSHIAAVAYQLLMADLRPSPLGHCDTREEVLAELKHFMDKKEPEPGQWLLGMGYDNSVFPDGRHLVREELDQISPTIPIAAIHISGHLCVMNTKGLELMGYTGNDYQVPEGGVVETTGLLKEQAFLGSDKMGRPSMEETLKAVREASFLYASQGFTTAQDGKTTKKEYELLTKAAGQGMLLNDVVSYIAADDARELMPPGPSPQNSYRDHLRFAGIKLFLDGSPQGKTAWLSRPYFCVPEGKEPDYRGFAVHTDAEVERLMDMAVKNRWQINVHANGDEAIEQMIRCYDAVLTRTGVKENLRPVVIHCQTARKDQLERMRPMGMTASFFVDHVYYWGDYHYDSVLGPERAERISPLAWAQELGIPFTLHQDSPVVPPNDLASIDHAVNRRTRKGRILGKEQCISTEEALKAVTIHAAYQIFEEDKKGSITPGKEADLVLLNENPLILPQERLNELQVVGTIKNGVWIYRAGDKSK